MEIAFKQNPYKEFDSLKEGQVFLFQGDCYMKTYSFEADGNDYNTVELRHGAFEYFHPQKEVEVISCKLYVE